ncbi:MAG TPA: hypothetical protein VF472_12045 [Burkholderiaceae bacterium]
MSFSAVTSTGKNTVGAARLAAYAFGLLLCLLNAGCLSTKSYVDPTLPKVQYSDLKPVDPKPVVQVVYEFQTNGASNPRATEATRGYVMDTLKTSNLFADLPAAPATAERKLYIVINNVFDSKEATGKGVGTGLTLGLAGTMVTDNYVMTASYDAPGAPEVKHSYRHALHSTIGNADGPKGLVATTPKEGGRTIVTDLTLNLLRDMSTSGELK